MRILGVCLLGLGVALAGCGSASDSADGAQEVSGSDNLIEGSKRLALKGYVAGSSSVADSMASESWEAACDAWAAQARSNTDGEIQTVTWGTPINAGVPDFRYESEPTLNVVIKATGDLQRVVPTRASGSLSGSLDDALSSWATECQRLIDKQKEQYGSRFAAGVCPRPSSVDPDDFQYSSDVVIYLRPIP